MLKVRSLMKDDKVIELFAKIDGLLFQKDFPWDEIHDKLIKTQMSKQ